MAKKNATPTLVVTGLNTKSALIDSRLNKNPHTITQTGFKVSTISFLPRHRVIATYNTMSA